MSSHLTIRVRRYRLLQFVFAVGGLMGIGIYMASGLVTALYVAAVLLYVSSLILRKQG